MSYMHGVSPCGLQVVDLDRDGIKDPVAGNIDDGNVEVFDRNGGAVIQAALD